MAIGIESETAMENLNDHKIKVNMAEGARYLLRTSLSYQEMRLQKLWS